MKKKDKIRHYYCLISQDNSGRIGIFANQSLDVFLYNNRIDNSVCVIQKKYYYLHEEYLKTKMV